MEANTGAEMHGQPSRAQHKSGESFEEEIGAGDILSPLGNLL